MSATRIAIVDDSEVTLEWAREQLTAFGFDVVVHRGPFGIYRLVKTHQPKLVLLDINMPGLSGSLACSLLKSKGIDDLLVILHSAIPKDEMEARVAECGADGCIQKTNDPAELARQIRALLEKPSN